MVSNGEVPSAPTPDDPGRRHTSSTNYGQEGRRPTVLGKELILKHNFRIMRFTCAVVAGPGPGVAWAAAPCGLRPGPQALPGGRAAPGAQRPCPGHLRTLSPGPPSHLRGPLRAVAPAAGPGPAAPAPGLPSPRTPASGWSTASSKPARCCHERKRYLPVRWAAGVLPPFRLLGRGAPDRRARPASGDRKRPRLTRGRGHQATRLPRVSGSSIQSA